MVVDSLHRLQAGSSFTSQGTCFVVNTSPANAGFGGRCSEFHEEAPVSHHLGQICGNEWYQTKEHKKSVCISVYLLLKIELKGRKDGERGTKGEFFKDGENF